MNTRSRSATVGGMISVSGGRTQTVQQQQEQEPQKSSSVLVLKLKNKSSIQWTEDTVDNENLGRKSSKRCCIYHKSKAFGESDSDESDSDTEQAKAQPNKGRHPNYQRHHA